MANIKTAGQPAPDQTKRSKMVEIRNRVEMMVRGIQVPKDRLPINEAAVKGLMMTSIRELGVVEPIVIWEPKSQLGMYLVVGANRLEACKRLKLKSIPAQIVRGNTPEVQRWCKLAKIDENLVRRELSAAQRAKLTAQRKAVYIEEHPETKHGAAPGAGKGKGKQRRKDAESASFVTDTAKKTGRSKRAIAQDARRGEKLADNILARVEGTTLAKGVELDALIDLDLEAREALISRAVAGENVSAVKEQPAPGKQGPINGRGELEPAEKATVRVESMLDRDSETREVIDTAISEAGDLPPKVRVRLVGALRGLAKRATRLADRLEGVEQAEARTHNAGNAGNGVDAAESAAARKIANADDELGPAR